MIRFLDIIFSFLGLLILSPLLLIVYLAIIVESRGGGFYSQTRVGKDGKHFKLYKFRSMRVDSDSKSQITIGARDPRITKTGLLVRRFKIDELPQLLNVLKGDMSLVGPRPEVPLYVNMYTLEQQKVLSVVPGITDYASIQYVYENEILGKAKDPHQTYIDVILPDKLKLNMKYINNRSVKEYFKVIFLTLGKIF